MLPVLAASRAFSPRTVQAVTELLPLPIDTELKDPSVVNVGEILLPAIAALAFTSALTISKAANFVFAIAALSFISAFYNSSIVNLNARHTISVEHGGANVKI